VLFAAIGSLPEMMTAGAEPVMAPDVPWAPEPSGSVAVVVDLPGEPAVRAGLALARRGYRPVPLFNGCPGPMHLFSDGSVSGSSLVDMHGLVQAVLGATPELARLRLPPEAPPAFLVDALRSGVGQLRTPRRFDNRWAVLPQDFPSASLLLSRGVQRALLVQDRRDQPRDDLAHVLRRWQEAGIGVDVMEVGFSEGPRPITVDKPSRFRWLFYTALVIAGLRRNSAGGFGGLIPEPSSGGG
jgi:hypothetical protein